MEVKKLGVRNSIKRIWVRGYSGVKGNRVIDQLARRGSVTLCIGPEPNSKARWEVRGWAI